MASPSERTRSDALLGGFSAEQIRRQVAVITGSKRFRHSRSLVRFLEFVVEETLDGRGENLKEYVLGVQVFGRGAAFDSKADTIVRVQAGNLRAKLADYYREEGRGDRLIVELPKGSYVPAFRLAPREPQVSMLRGNRGWALVFAAGLAAALLGGVLWLGKTAPDWSSAGLERLTFDSGFTGHPSVSRDGRLLAYASDRAGDGATDIWIQATSGQSTALRMTDDPARDEAPSLSPDGSLVAFRSWRQGGGIWVSPTARREPHLVAPGGYSPRFSPDGKQILYSATGPHDTNDRIYVISANGGQPRVLSTHGTEANCPIWTPDGKHVLFVDAVHDDSNQYDWYVTSTESSGPVVRVGLSEQIGVGKFTCASGWVGNEALFRAPALRSLPISPYTWRASGPSRAVLPITAYWGTVVRQEGKPSYLYYSVEEVLGQLWSLPVSANTGEVRGPLERLAFNATMEIGLPPDQRLSLDEKTLWFVASSPTGSPKIWRLALSDGRVVPMDGLLWTERRPIPDRSSRRVLFQVDRNGQKAVFLSDERGQREICGGCGDPIGWLPDEVSFLSVLDGKLLSVDTDTGASRELWKAARLRVFDAALSPDGRWVALSVLEQGSSLLRGFLAPYPLSGDSTVWIPITNAPFELFLAWSRDGNLVYFFDVRDEFRCLYAQKLDHRKRPVGPAFAVQHFHRMQWRGARIAVASDRLILSLATQHSNIWRARLDDTGNAFLQKYFPFIFHR